MKRESKHKRKWLFLILGAALGVPVTVLAISVSGNDLDIDSYGLFGGATGPGNGGAALAVGYTAQWDSTKDGMAAVGSNVNAYDSNSMVVGYWNKQTGGSGDAFVVGYGTSTEPKNAVEVHSDGTVRIGEAQHESAASMGGFGDPNN